MATLRSSGRLALAVLAGLAVFGLVIGAATTSTATPAKKGCWYEPPNPPACDICGWDCDEGGGQQCCTIGT